MKTIKKIVLAMVLLLVGYGLALLILPHIAIKAETVHQLREVNVFIKSNGVHTDIVVPIKNKFYDWNTVVKQKHTLQPSSNMNYVAVGWGDKGFYLNTPTWDDLTFETAFRAATGLSTTAIHITYYKKMLENERCVKLILTEKQYQQLCAYIVNSAQLKNNEFIPIKTDAVYGNHDAFYEAKGTYSLFKSCNTWTNKALKTSGQKACLWTVLDTPILNKY